MSTGFVSSQSRHYAAAFSRPHLSVGCKQPAVAHDASRAMTSPRERRVDDNVELLPLKSVLVNNNYKEDEAYYPPTPAFHPHPSSSNLYEYTLLSKRTPVSKRLVLFFFMLSNKSQQFFIIIRTLLIIIALYIILFS